MILQPIDVFAAAPPGWSPGESFPVSVDAPGTTPGCGCGFGVSVDDLGSYKQKQVTATD